MNLLGYDVTHKCPIFGKIVKTKTMCVASGNDISITTIYKGFLLIIKLN